jgi:BirA family transcriptional regulator, biotin operon repressor / biotin---[acetyl-CoA-carboxylase] ligase
VGRLLGCVVHTFEEIDSTQAALARLAAAGAPEGSVVVARHQTEGRGRRGRRWWDSPGDALLFSVLLNPPTPAARVPQLSLVAGLAVTDALEAAAGVSARLRWPNDVLIDGRKVCGILPDAVSLSHEHVGQVILGIGINVNQTAFPAELEDLATSLCIVTGTRHDPGALLSAVLEALERRYREWLDAGFVRAREEWQRRSSTVGRCVRTPEGHEGVAVGVSEDGALLVETADGMLVRVVSGPAWEVERGAARH